MAPKLNPKYKRHLALVQAWENVRKADATFYAAVAVCIKARDIESFARFCQWQDKQTVKRNDKD